MSRNRLLPEVDKVKDLLRWFRAKAHECPECGWQGMAEPGAEVLCPECGEPARRRSWLDTWGLTLLVLSVVAAIVLLVAFVGQQRW